MNPLRIFDLARRRFYEFLTILLAVVLVCAGGLRAQNGPDNVALQIARLKSPNTELRRYAADALAKFGDKRAVQPLIGALGDSDTQVRATAAIGLGSLKDAQAVKPLIEALTDDDENVSTAAAISLGEIHDSRAVAPLIAAMAKVSIATTELAIFVPGAVEPLLAAAKDPDADLRRGAIVALADSHDPRAIPVLIAAVGDDDAGVRQMALIYLEASKSPAFAGALKTELNGPDSQTRAIALRATGTLSLAESVPIVLAAMHDPDASIRNAAATYLTPAESSDPQVAQALIALVQDRDGSVSWGALNALATSRDAKAIDAMLAFAQGKVPNVDPYFAMEQLSKVNDPRAFDLLAGAVRRVDSRMAMIAAEQLGNMRDPRAVPVLAAAVTGNVPNVANDALVSLGKIGAPAVDALIGLLNQPGLQNVAIGALANTHDPRAVQPLIDLLATPYKGISQPYGAAITQTPDDPGPVRPMTYSAILSALGELGDSRAVAPLIDYMQRGPVGRGLVPQELAAIGTASIEPLIPLLKHENENTRRLAAEALSDLALKQDKDARPHDALVAAMGAHDIAITAGGYEFYVGLGAPASEQDLVAAFDKYPDQGMAEYFLNCGDVALEDAAIAWGQKNHYHITQQMYGVVWGRMPKPATDPISFVEACERSHARA